MLRAKSRGEYLKNTALFVGALLLVLVLVNLAGMVPFSHANMPPEAVLDPLEVLSRLPSAQLLFLGLAGATWIIAGNVLSVLHKRRRREFSARDESA